MKITILFFLLFIFELSNFSQSPLSIKEQYDYTHSNLMYNNTYKGVINYIEYTKPLNEYAYGEQLGYVYFYRENCS